MRENTEAVILAGVGMVQGGYKYGVKPFFKEHPGVVGWGLTLGAATVFDAWAMLTKHETMSHAFRTAYEHPIYRFACVGAIGGLAVHLMREP